MLRSAVRERRPPTYVGPHGFDVYDAHPQVPWLSPSFVQRTNNNFASTTNNGLPGPATNTYRAILRSNPQIRSELYLAYKSPALTMPASW